MLENTWFYYFSSLSQTIAACSALLVALAIIRVQNISGSLNTIERLIAEVFYNIGEYDIYKSNALPYIHNENWIAYLKTVKDLSESNTEKFANRGNYIQSREFLDSLIEQVYKLELRNRHLHFALTFSFGGSVIFAGTAILIIPIAQWVSSTMLLLSWAISGIFLVVLFMFYLRLVLDALKPCRKEKT